MHRLQTCSPLHCSLHAHGSHDAQLTTAISAARIMPVPLPYVKHRAKETLQGGGRGILGPYGIESLDQAIPEARLGWLL